MATENTLRFIRVDYQAHKDALLQRVRARYPRLWNDFLNNSFGIVLVDMIAWSTATMAFLVNRAAGENYISTMTLRESAVNIGSLTGYQLRGPTAASVACEASITEPQPLTTVTIAKGTVVRSSSEEALPFEVAQDYYILPGNTTPVTPVVSISPTLSGAQVLSTLVLVTPGSSNADLLDTSVNLKDFVQVGQVFRVEGETTGYLIQDIQASPGAVSNNRLILAEPYAGTVQTSVTGEIYDQRINCVQGLTVKDSFISPPDSTPSYVVKLSTTPVVEGSVSVVVNGTEWNQVTSFAKSTGDAQDYMFKVTASGQPLVIFGDGTLGQIIPTEATILVTYRVGGGSAGNVPLNSINTSITGLLTTTNNPITVAIKNTTSAGTGGREAETLEEARVNIPAATRANDRAVTLEDYQTMAMSYDGVVYARASVRTENALLEGNIVFIYAWTSGPTGSLVNLSPQQKLELENFMQTKALGTDLVRIGDGTAVPIPVSMRYKVFQGFSVTDTGLLVQDTLNSYVDVLRPGQPVLYSNLVRLLDEVYGVDTITMATPTSDLFPSNSLELFTRPDANFSYDLAKNGVGNPVYSNLDGVQISQYIAQLPVYPIEAWSVRLFLGVKELTIQPGILPGNAQVFGDNLSADLTYPSTINLLTGQVSLWIKGAPGDLSMKLIPIDGYATEKLVNIYVGYSGNTSQTKRREIRSAVRSYGDGLMVGAPIYGSEIAGIVGSKSNITQVIGAVDGVVSVNRVALDTPGNTSKMIATVETELLRIGDVILNNEVD
jgi:hypothetical protein